MELGICFALPLAGSSCRRFSQQISKLTLMISYTCEYYSTAHYFKPYECSPSSRLIPFTWYSERSHNYLSRSPIQPSKSILIVHPSCILCVPTHVFKNHSSSGVPSCGDDQPRLVNVTLSTLDLCVFISNYTVLCKWPRQVGFLFTSAQLVVCFIYPLRCILLFKRKLCYLLIFTHTNYQCANKCLNRRQ